MIAIRDVSIGAELRRLDALVSAMREKGTLEDTTLIVTGDVPLLLPPAAKPAAPSASTSASARPPAPPPSISASAPAASKGPPPPYVPPSLVARDGEEPLAIPLLIRFPAHHAAGRVVTAITDPTDVAATILASFGASIDGFAGRDLAMLAVDDELSRDAPQLEDDGHAYQLTWGDLRLVGVWGKTPSLRMVYGSDDVRADRPFEYLVAWGLAADARARWLDARAKGPGREPATIDAATQLALDEWEKSK
jgi:arylsulfatase A-like enzyme